MEAVGETNRGPLETRFPICAHVLFPRDSAGAATSCALDQKGELQALLHKTVQRPCPPGGSAGTVLKDVPVASQPSAPICLADDGSVYANLGGGLSKG